MTPSKFLCLTTIVVAITIADTKSISTIQQANNAIQLNPNTNQSNNLKESLIAMRSRYTQTLLNETNLPFLKNCTFVYTTTSPPSTQSSSPSIAATPSNTLKPGDENLLCLVYYDMVYNLGKSGFTDYQIESDVIDTLKSYDNDTIATNFCQLFNGEIPTEAGDRPFETKLSPNKRTSSEIFKNEHTCSLLCCEADENFVLKIKPVCKLISGGYRALHRHLIDHDEVPETNAQKPKITKPVDSQLQAVKIDVVKQVVPVVLPIPVEPAKKESSPVKPVPIAPVPVAPLPVGPVSGEAVPAVVVVSTSAPIVVLPPVRSVFEPVAEGISSAASANVANINFGNKPSTPNLSLSAAPVINQTNENAAVPLANGKAFTKEMKPTPKDVNPVEPNEEPADKIDVPLGEEEETNDYPIGKFITFI